jgi:serine/threonine-protein kinase
MVHKGDTVTLTVIGAPTQVTVPSVVGENVNSATTQLQQAGFVVSRQQQNSNQPAGTVIAQSPSANAQVDQGSTVTITVSSGPAQVQVPDVTNQDQNTARTTLQQAGLTVGNVTNQPSPTVPNGTVISTSPSAGTSVNPGTAVNLVVSTGPPQQQSQIPNVVGLTQAQAQSVLSYTGFQVAVQNAPVSDRNQDGKVQVENPPGGSQANQGSTVTIVVGQFSSGTTTTVPVP